MKSLYAKIAFILLFATVRCYAQFEINSVENYFKAFANYRLNRPQEKIYIHTDRSIYSPGQSIWMKLYLTNASTNKASNLSRIGFVELYDSSGKLVGKVTNYFEGGVSAGKIDLPNDLNPGIYLLKAYTSFMKNFDDAFYFRQSIEIVDAYKNDDLTVSTLNIQNDLQPKNIIAPDLQFFPEGGTLIAGNYISLAFKGIDVSGYGFRFKGVIKNKSGKEVQEFESNKLGMGSFMFKPYEGERYTASIIHGNYVYEYALPEVRSSGYTLRANIHNRNLSIMGKYIGKDEEKKFVVLVHNRGIVLAYGLSENNNFLAHINVDTSPEGIITITLMDEKGKVKCERLVFVQKNKEPKVDLVQDKLSWDQREKAHVTLAINEHFQSDSIKLSMSIARPIYFKNSDSELTIRSYLLLTSDLKGNIESPGFYFDSTNTNRNKDIDDLLLTQGWRRYDQDNMDVYDSTSLSIKPELGLTISGRLVDFYNRQKDRAGLKMSANSVNYYNQYKGREGSVGLYIFENGYYDERVNTDEDGYFKYNELYYYDTVNAIFQGVIKRKKGRVKKSKDPVKVIIDHEKDSVLFNASDLEYVEKEKHSAESAYKSAIRKINEIDSAYFANNNVKVLDEVKVSAKKETDIAEGRGIFYGKPSQRINIDSIPNGSNYLVIDLLKRFPGVQIMRSPPDLYAIVRGFSSITLSSAAMILLDGMQVDLSYFYGMSASEIQFIDLITGPRAAIFGGRGGNGIIAIYSKRGGNSVDEREDWGINAVKLVGIQSPSEFYTPKFLADVEDKVKPMYKNTLYWKPDITLYPNQSTDISFYTTDEMADYNIILEGLSAEGVPYYQVFPFSVK